MLKIKTSIGFVICCYLSLLIYSDAFYRILALLISVIYSISGVLSFILMMVVHIINLLNHSPFHVIIKIKTTSM